MHVGLSGWYDLAQLTQASIHLSSEDKHSEDPLGVMTGLEVLMLPCKVITEIVCGARRSFGVKEFPKQSSECEEMRGTGRAHVRQYLSPVRGSITSALEENTIKDTLILGLKTNTKTLKCSIVVGQS